MRMSHKLATWGGAKAKIEYTYTGDYIASNVMVNGVKYVQLEIKSSGTLSIKGKAMAKVWCVGGGASGRRMTAPTSSPIVCNGGGSGYVAMGEALLTGDMPVVIGAGGAASSGAHNPGSATSFGGFVANGGTANAGGSGGGALGTGAGVSTRPFGDAINFPSLIAAGGGQGGLKLFGVTVSGPNGRGDTFDGGDGGSDGSHGGAGWIKTSASASGGNGGATGGGNGGNATAYSVTAGANATTYGSGGGGGGAIVDYTNYTHDPTWLSANGGAGYQGVLYIRVLAKDVV